MTEVAALHEVVLDDREVLLDEGGKRRALAVRAQLHSSIQRVGILRSLRDIGTLQSCLLARRINIRQLSVEARRGSTAAAHSIQKS